MRDCKAVCRILVIQHCPSFELTFSVLKQLHSPRYKIALNALPPSPPPTRIRKPTHQILCNARAEIKCLLHTNLIEQESITTPLVSNAGYSSPQANSNYLIFIGKGLQVKSRPFHLVSENCNKCWIVQCLHTRGM